jgi:hypothetical protein
LLGCCEIPATPKKEQKQKGTVSSFLALSSPWIRESPRKHKLKSHFDTNQERNSYFAPLARLRYLTFDGEEG